MKEYFDIAAAEGATVALGGDLPTDPSLAGGFYVNPTIYKNVDNSMRIAREEIFGPVLVAIPFDTERMRSALRTTLTSAWSEVCGHRMCLGRFVWRRRSKRARSMSTPWFSTGSVQTSFGGHKLSGYGREKGIEALNHYSQLKSVTIKLS